jgi:transposase
MKAYSVDFRQKILDAYYSVPISQSQLAERFSVARSFVQKLIKQYRLTGNITPKHGGGSQLKLSPEQLALLAELIEDNNDATLEELCQMLASKTGVVVSIATMGRMTERLKLTVKKNTISSRKRNRKSATSQI